MYNIVFVFLVCNVNGMKFLKINLFYLKIIGKKLNNFCLF